MLRLQRIAVSQRASSSCLQKPTKQLKRCTQRFTQSCGSQGQSFPANFIRSGMTTEKELNSLKIFSEKTSTSINR